MSTIKMMSIAIAIVLSASGSMALAQGSPDLDRPAHSRTTWHPQFPAGTAANPVMSVADARARLQADGYRAISQLARSSDGAWRGTAIRGAAKLNVAVDPQGRVFAQ